MKPSIQKIDLKNLHINDAFWSRYIRLVREVTIPYQWAILNDSIEGAKKSHCIDNFRVAAGEKDGSFEGAVFQDSDLAKWLEAVAYSLAIYPDPELESLADDAIELIGRAQQPDGYLNTYFTVAAPECRWKNLREGHELYTAGHFIEAAVAYHQSTGKRRLLDIMCRYADLISSMFIGEKAELDGYPGHPEVELALYKLYQETKVNRYLELAQYFINRRGKLPDSFLEEKNRIGWKQIFEEFKTYDPLYAQNHLPVRKQFSAEGHAVRAVYLYCAMADLANETCDDDLLVACKRLWENITQKRMYLTGGIGSSGHLERFTTDYDLPNDRCYCETCASIGLAQFGLRMAKITCDAHYIEAVERSLYNIVTAGIALDGKSFFYVNPLEVWPSACMDHTSLAHVKSVRQKWFDVACCPPNIARTLASLGQFIYHRTDDHLFLNLYIDNQMEQNINDSNVSFNLKTSYLIDGKSTLTVKTDKPCRFTLGLRIPEYAKSYSFSIDGSQANVVIEKGYALITQLWTKESCVEITFEIPAQFVTANPEVRSNIGKVALIKGPLVYCVEEIDNGPNLASIIVDPDEPIVEEWDQDLFGGTLILKCNCRKISAKNWGHELYQSQKYITEPMMLKAIPYGLWANRQPGEMAVWLNSNILKSN